VHRTRTLEKHCVLIPPLSAYRRLPPLSGNAGEPCSLRIREGRNTFSLMARGPRRRAERRFATRGREKHCSSCIRRVSGKRFTGSTHAARAVKASRLLRWTDERSRIARQLCNVRCGTPSLFFKRFSTFVERRFIRRRYSGRTPASR
jgi:hypothetical protein